MVPMDSGSGGGQTTSGRGGGNVRVECGRYELSGWMLAEGQSSPAGGAGGSILLVVNELSMTSTARISADGGTYGGGGRVAVYYDTLIGTLPEASLKASGSSATGGTILVHRSGSPWARLIIDSQAYQGPTPLWYGDRVRGYEAGKLPFAIDLVVRSGASYELLTPEVFDQDNDGYFDWEELARGTDPHKADSNDDGIDDQTSVEVGRDPLALDVDGDGVANADELVRGTDPMTADTDGDGVGDGVDAYPLDPAGNSFPPPTPGDVAAPLVTIAVPRTATLMP